MCVGRGGGALQYLQTCSLDTRSVCYDMSPYILIVVLFSSNIMLWGALVLPQMPCSTMTMTKCSRLCDDTLIYKLLEAEPSHEDDVVENNSDNGEQDNMEERTMHLKLKTCYWKIKNRMISDLNEDDDDMLLA